MTETRAYAYTDVLEAEHYAKALRADIRDGLTGVPKSTAPTWFYDARGSELFEEITQLPEYPLWRAELGLLQLHARDVAGRTGARSLVELGSGSSTKSKLIIEALDPAGLHYVAVDVSADALHEAGAQLVRDYPGIRLHALRADFTAPLVLPALPEDGPRLIAFLGSTLGNFRRSARGPFLRGLRDIMRPEDFLLIGADLVKTEQEMTAAYDDAQGVTAEFNKNLLHVLNRELDADFDPDAFDHVSVWNSSESHIEMRLRSRFEQLVKIRELDLAVRFGDAEEWITERSAKFTTDGLREELTDAGLRTQQLWADSDAGFALVLATAR
ncbi:L-histidine N(alpha)-methyltransferase [Streptomyces chromofuscus]|uniref:L-histidine N(Alpha)-methyltransferase n=1 Tax=Streptomyces chromofuscus TaxID=42881 RepID=A0A7M2TAF7_STRCW|nr:L-histidine N(alpha)-methyltransferase [Streptomyces chromofuscus]QOV44331.1 L-histidine N(alpha)-methyltransferase [Streptomyces chromofuscus]GGT23528.1 histidine N-alpha-methyltransferase [Streptomyces chromofuscus]